jgi:acyl dehydratase
MTGTGIGTIRSEAHVKEVVQRGLWFEEYEAGVIYRHRPGRTLTEADNQLFSALSMNQQAIHVDSAFAATQEFGRPLMNSMLTLAALVGLSVNQLTQGTIVANLGFTDVAFPKPVFAGDTLYGQTTLLEKRESKSRPAQGIVTLEHVGLNQHDEVVARAVRAVLIKKRPG